MSGFHTHMLIGAVGGLATFKIVQHVAPTALSVQFSAGSSAYTVPTSVIGIGGMLVSAYLALWPDIDEPRSHISHRASHLMWLFGAAIGLMIAFAASNSALVMLLGFVLGAVVGSLTGGLVLATLRLVSGGHRRLTHSILVGTALVVLGGVLYFIGLKWLVLPALALAWGQFLHLVGDVVTPEGVPLFYPLWREDIHFFPYYVSPFGEIVVAFAALFVGVAFLLL